MAKRSRFEVPFSPPRRQQASRQHGRPFLGDTNRALINGGIVVITTLLTTVFLLAISGQVYDTTNASLITQGGPQVTGSIALTSSPQPITALASPSPSATRATASPSPSAAPPPLAEEPPSDSEIQASIDRRLENDQSLTGLGITATVNEGKVILVGTAPSDAVKAKVEKMIRSIVGVKQVDNQIAVVVN
ncbi:MAG TPA: BON domain-containing protein [Pyrinomonadaceae bacterium]|nr:BON domain-containing protein [Pyrinomonadaceae bacterium]